MTQSRKRSVISLGKFYGSDGGGLLKGAKELEKYNILEILPGILKIFGSSFRREANYYRLNPFPEK